MPKSKFREVYEKDPEKVMQAIYDLFNMAFEQLTEEEINAELLEAGYTPEKLKEFSDKIQKLADRELAKMKKKIEEENNVF